MQKTGDHQGSIELRFLQKRDSYEKKSGIWEKTQIKAKPKRERKYFVDERLVDSGEEQNLSTQLPQGLKNSFD